MTQFELTRERQVSVSRRTAKLSRKALSEKKQLLGPALPKGSVGPGAVLLCALAGASGVALVPALSVFAPACEGFSEERTR